MRSSYHFSLAAASLFGFQTSRTQQAQPKHPVESHGVILCHDVLGSLRFGAPSAISQDSAHVLKNDLSFAEIIKFKKSKIFQYFWWCVLASLICLSILPKSKLIDCQGISPTRPASPPRLPASPPLLPASSPLLPASFGLILTAPGHCFAHSDTI